MPRNVGLAVLMGLGLAVPAIAIGQGGAVQSKSAAVQAASDEQKVHSEEPVSLEDPAPQLDEQGNSIAPVVTVTGEPEELPLPMTIVSPGSVSSGSVSSGSVSSGSVSSGSVSSGSVSSGSVALGQAPLSSVPAEDSPAILSDELDLVETPLAASAAPSVPPPKFERGLHDFWGYRASEQAWGWTMGDGDQFGGFWMLPDPYRKAGVDSGLTFGVGVGFLSGPERTDMPPRVFDLSLGYQKRKQIGDFYYDIAGSFLISTDFEGSSRDGVRFPGHAVGFYRLNPQMDVVFGVDFLDRGDIQALPVGGVLWKPDPDLRVELVFPRPRVEMQLTEYGRLYVYGGLGGGSWAIERDSELDDVASLYELQLAVGLMSVADIIGDSNSLEFVYLFDRKLEYEFGRGDYEIGPTLMIRTVTHY